MSYLIILCLIQSITEFLPVSSTAHMIFIEKIIGVESASSLWHTALHLGSFFAIVTFYAKDIFYLISHFIKGAFIPGLRENEYYKMSMYLLAATLPAIIVGYFLKPMLHFLHNNLYIIAISSILFGGLLAYVDAEQNEDYERLTFKTALVMGFAQLFAFFPGGSRLGTTVTAARLMGISRFQAFRYSMLLSVPVVLGAVVLSLKDSYECGQNFMNDQFIYATAFTFTLSFCVLSLVQKYIGRMGFAMFGIYRIISGLALLLFLFFNII
jgi:undecaprenyl-diphosphatase